MARRRMGVRAGMALGTMFHGNAVVLESLFTNDADPAAMAPPPPAVV